jgi:hypothetical protein
MDIGKPRQTRPFKILNIHVYIPFITFIPDQRTLAC